MEPSASPGIPPPGGPGRLLATLVAFGVLAALALLTAVVRQGRIVSQQALGPAEAINESLRRQQTADPGLIGWREERSIALDLAEPRGLAVDPVNGDILVVGDRAGRSFSAGGASRSGCALAEPPQCVAVEAKTRTVYLGFRDRVQVCAPGSWWPVASWPSLGPKAFVTCIAPSGSDVWVADAGNRVVWRCDKSGHVLGDIGRRDRQKRTPGLVMPSPHLDVVPLPGGLLLVNNPGRRAVETYAPGGTLKTSWGRASTDLADFCGCCNPVDIAVLPDKTGRVVTLEKGLVRVKVYRAEGTLESVVATPEQFKQPAADRDLAVDNRGRILVLDPPMQSVRVFVPKAQPGGTKR